MKKASTKTAPVPAPKAKTTTSSTKEKGKKSLKTATKAVVFTSYHGNSSITNGAAPTITIIPAAHPVLQKKAKTKTPSAKPTVIARTTIENQNRIILAFFKKNPTKEFTPPEVLNGTRLSMNALLTSVRRSITNHTNRGRLEKTGNQKMGMYGKSNCCWKLA